jgi:parallel beta-helix repeat protein
MALMEQASMECKRMQNTKTILTSMFCLSVRNMIIATVFCAGALSADIGSAANYYVAKTGNDANSCVQAQSISTPMLTIMAGVGCLSAGDTLQIRGGTYAEWVNITNRSGSANNPITITNFPAEIVTVRPPSKLEAFWLEGNNANYWTIKAQVLGQMVLDGSNNAPNQLADGIGYRFGTSGPHHITIENLEIKNFTGNGILDSAPYNLPGNVIRGNKIHDNGVYYAVDGSMRWCMYVAGVGTLIENNECYNGYNGGIQVQGDQSNQTVSHNIIVRNNYVHDNGALGGHGIGIVAWYSDNMQVYNNISVNNSAQGIWLNRSSGSQIYSNTLYGNAAGGFYASSAQNPIVRNNIAYNNTGNQIEFGATVGGQISDHNLITNPSFVNPGAKDFHLQAGSAGIDTGLVLGTPYNLDHDGNARPTGASYDIGAYESTTNTSASLIPPSNLFVTP